MKIGSKRELRSKMELSLRFAPLGVKPNALFPKVNKEHGVLA